MFSIKGDAKAISTGLRSDSKAITGSANMCIWENPVSGSSESSDLVIRIFGAMVMGIQNNRVKQ